MEWGSSPFESVVFLSFSKLNCVLDVSMTTQPQAEAVHAADSNDPHMHLTASVFLTFGIERWVGMVLHCRVKGRVRNLGTPLVDFASKSQP